MPDALIFAYIGVSLLFGGAAATIETWIKPLMLDRADGRGKFRSPKMTFKETLLIGLFVAICWPALVVGMIFAVIARQLS